MTEEALEIPTEKATFAIGAGCAAEWVFSSWRPGPLGIISTRVGTATGANPDITVEAVEVTYDPDNVSFQMLLTRFWEAHDQWSAPDRRLAGFANAVFAHSPEQRAEAERFQDEEAPLIQPPPGEDQQASVHTLISDLQSFIAAPAHHPQVITRMTQAVGGAPTLYRADPSSGVAELVDDYYPPAPSQSSDADPSDDAALDELRALADKIGACLDERNAVPGTRLPPFVDRIFAVAQHGAGQIHQLVTVLRDWLATTPSAGMADGQSDIRIAEAGVTPLAAESYLRMFRTCSELHVINSLRPGYNSPSSVRCRSFRRALTDLDSDGRPIDTIAEMEIGTGSLSAPIEAPRMHRHVEPLADRHTGRWYEHIPPAEMPISCFDGKAVHVVRWRQGRLEAPAVDELGVTPEATLAALGAPTCRCSTLLEAWDPRWLLQRFQPPDFSLQPQSWWLGASPAPEQPGWVYQAPVSRSRRQRRPRPHHPDRRIPPDPTRADLPLIVGALDLPFAPQATTDEKRAVWMLVQRLLPLQSREMRTRWLLTALAWLTEHHDRLGPDDRTNYANLVFRHLEPPLLEALWQPCRYDPNVRMAAIQLHLIEPDKPAQVTGTVDAGLVTIDAGVSFHWITQVWTRGLAIIDGHLVLDAARHTDPHTVDVAVTHWDRDTDHSTGATLVTRQTTAHWDGEAWRLE